MATPVPAPIRPACVSQLRIAGLKLFAEPVALDILPGLTGLTCLVGRNGCSNSNVVDALRWAVGEGNARTLRGAKIEDVIFAGTVVRPGLQGAAAISRRGTPQVRRGVAEERRTWA